MKRKNNDELAMTPEEARLHRELNRAMEQETIYVDRHDAPVTLSKVDGRLVTFHSMLIANCADFFAVRFRRIKLQQFLHRLRRSTETIEAGGEEPQQAELQFPDIEEFRGLPMLFPITNPKTGENESINYRFASNEAQRAAMLEFKDSGIAADQRSRQKLAAANRLCSQLVKRFGDLPPYDLLKAAEKDRGASAV